MDREGISSDYGCEKIAELPGAATPGPHHFPGLLDRGTKADRCLEWIEKAYPQTPDLKKLTELPGAAYPGSLHFATILDKGIKADSD